MPIAYAVVAAVAPLLPPPILSPANLPRPPVASDGGYDAAFNFKFWETTGSPERLAVRAVTAMQREGFRFAEASLGGLAVGYSDTCRAAVFTVPYGDKLEAFVFAASRSYDEARRVGESIHDYISKAPDDPKAPKVIGTRDPKREAELPTLGWHVDIRPAHPIGKHVANVTALVLEKQGCTVQTIVTGMACGCTPQHRTMVMGVATGDQRSILFITVSVAAKSETAADTAKAICTAVTKILFE
jgi:hypothetical protein